MNNMLLLRAHCGKRAPSPFGYTKGSECGKLAGQLGAAGPSVFSRRLWEPLGCDSFHEIQSDTKRLLLSPSRSSPTQTEKLELARYRINRPHKDDLWALDGNSLAGLTWEAPTTKLPLLPDQRLDTHVCRNATARSARGAAYGRKETGRTGVTKAVRELHHKLTSSLPSVREIAELRVRFTAPGRLPLLNQESSCNTATLTASTASSHSNLELELNSNIWDTAHPVGVLMSAASPEGQKSLTFTTHGYETVENGEKNLINTTDEWHPMSTRHNDTHDDSSYTSDARTHSFEQSVDRTFDGEETGAHTYTQSTSRTMHGEYHSNKQKMSPIRPKRKKYIVKDTPAKDESAYSNSNTQKKGALGLKGSCVSIALVHRSTDRMNRYNSLHRPIAVTDALRKKLAARAVKLSAQQSVVS